MSDILLEELNPHGTIWAIVESDDRTCYFYLYAAEGAEFNMKSVWVRNLAAAPDELDSAAMSEGLPPLNPREFCKRPGPRPAPVASDLSVVWLPEGNGAALYEQGRVLAIIPSWSNMLGFCGYSSDCIGEGPVAWELSEDNEQLKRFGEAGRFWAAWDEDPWPELSDRLIDEIEARLGQQTNYYAIDGGKWPPRAMLRIPRFGGTALVTIGLSILPQPNTDFVTSGAALIPRIELGAVLPAGWPEQAVKNFAGYVSGQASLPWNRNSFFGPGHTILCDSWVSPQFTAALFVDAHPAVPPFVLSHQFAENIPVLWLLPITEAEREFAIAHGSNALLAKLPDTRWQEG